MIDGAPVELKGKIHVKHGFPFKSEFFREQGKYVVLTPGNFYEEGGFKRNQEKDKCYSHTFPGEYLLKKGGLLVAMTEQTEGLLGSLAWVPEDDRFLHNQRLGLVTAVNDEVSLDYLYHLFKTKHVREQIRLTSTGSKVKHTSPERIYQVKVPLPSPPVQRRVADVLSALDAKIDLNHRINEELEGLAKLLYDYWFVQFDFPISAEQAAAMGDPSLEGKPYRQSGGKMTYNETLKREFPEGWGVNSLGLCVDGILDHRGKTPKKLGGSWSTEEDSIIALSAKVVKGGKLVGLENANRVDRELYEKWMPEKLEDGDILMTSEAPAGELYFVHGKTEYCLSQRLFGIRANPNVVTPCYLYHELSSGNAHYQIQGSLSGSTVFGIRQDVLRTISIVVPGRQTLERFETAVLPLMKKTKVLEEQNRQLASLRNWLLPMLMNGQVTVAE